ncbi:MAG: response regulator transcription factor [Chloroflexota bacterium]|nr:MAG: response regulator transcription factor [Chloroflexota bacterium]
MTTLAHYETWGSAGSGKPMKQIKVLIVEEHLAVRRALAARLDSFSHIEVVATAPSFAEGLEKVGRCQPDVILLELKGAPELVNPVGELNKAIAGHPAGIIVLTSYADDDEREAALQAGARRYLLKQIDSARLLNEIEAVASEVAV